jgi:type II secretory pathway pseudopilin PulG
MNRFSRAREAQRYRGGGYRGMTVVELVTVLVLLIILGAIAIPSISPVVLRYRLRGAAWQVAGDLRLARQRAVTIKKRFRVCVTNCDIAVPPGGYSVERDDGPPGGPAVWVNEDGVATRLPPDVTVAANSNPTFTITGVAGGATMTLSNLVGSYDVVVAQSGRVMVCEGSCP